MKIITQERFEELLSGRMDEITPGEVKSVITAAIESGLKCEAKEYNNTHMTRKTEIPSMKSWFTAYPEGLWPDNLYLDFGSITLDIYKTEDDYYPVIMYSRIDDLDRYKLCDGITQVADLVRSISDY